jgi:hypothetical protein
MVSVWEGPLTQCAHNSKGSRFGRGKKYHEVYSKKNIQEESRHIIKTKIGAI